MTAKRFLSTFIALVMALALVPVARIASLADTNWTVPEGYCELEYNQLAEFFETEDENGVKNGTKLNEEYDVNDPETWGDGWVFMPFDEPYHVMFFQYGGSVNNYNLVGEIDLSNFESLSGINLSFNAITKINASNCPELDDVDISNGKVREADFTGCEMLNNIMCNDNELTSLIVDGCTGMVTGIFCENNLLTELDVSDCADMVTLDCGYNELTNINVANCAALSTLNAQFNDLSELDLRDCASLKVLNLEGNSFKLLDLSANPNMKFDLITAEGSGSFGYWQTLQGSNILAILYAYADEGETFLGWYDENGNLLGTEAEWNVSAEELPENIVAKFSETLPTYYTVTFVDWDGTVLSTQQVLEGEAAVAPADPEREGYNFIGWDVEFSNVTSNLTVTAQYEEIPQTYLKGDYNRNGEVTATDALLLLRAVMNGDEFSAEDIEICDMNGDGNLTGTDALLILRLSMDA